MAEMGQRMLRGERMMAEACPNCPVPLMASERGCVCCQCHTVWQQDEEGGFRRKETPETKRSALPVQPPVRRAREAEEREEADDDGGGGVGPVGQKLLEGWTMLADACPLCSNPIMRNPADRSMWCVKCNVKAVTEEEWDSSKYQHANASNVKQQRQQQVAPLPPRQEPQQQPCAAPVQAALAPTVASQPLLPLHRTAGGARVSLQSASDSLKQTLANRLALADAALQDMPIENTQCADRMLHHIQAILETLNRL